MQVLGRYTVLSRIGTGGMAEVFLARARGAQGTEKLLVIKKIHPALASDVRFLELFVSEARVAMRLNHSNIVQVYDFEKIDDTYLLAMEYVDGADLHRTAALARQASVALPFALAAHVAREVAKGLDYAHGRRGDRDEPLGIVHRDVSPQNVLLGRDGAVKIADFGIARAGWIREESSGTLRGKVGYMAPEQARGEIVDARADVFSLGVVLRELLTGRPLLQGLSGEAALEAARRAEHPAPRELDPSIPAELDAVVRRAMAPSPGDRYGSARELALDLGGWLHTLTSMVDATTLGDWISRLLPSAAGADPAPGSASGPPGIAEQPRTVRLRPDDPEERRPAVAVSVRLDLPPGAEREAIRAGFVRLAGELAYKESGILREDADRPRIYLGLPRSTFEDAVRGLRVARDLEDAARGLAADHRAELRLRAVVARGEVRFREHEGGSNFDFEPEPELLRQSEALLDAAAHGECLAGGGIYRLARWEYNFGPPRTLAGGEAGDGEPVKAFPVLAARSREERARGRLAEGRLWGRDDELARLEEAFGRAAAGISVLVRVMGDLGIGKSRLLAEFTASLGPDAATVISAECLFAERQTPLAAAAAVVRAVLTLPDGTVGRELGDRLAGFLAGAPAYLRRQESFFRELLRSPESAWARQRERRRELVRRTAFGLGTLVGLHARRRTVVIVVENAQWLDGPSVDVLSELARAGARSPVLVLLAGYTGTLAERRIAGLEDLTLSELPAADIRRIVADRLGDDPGIAEVADQVVARAQGNPFFACELIEALEEQGFIVPAEGAPGRRYRQGRPGAIRLPTTMEGLATAQLDVLDPPLRATLRAAAAVGAVFNAVTVGLLLGRPAEREVRALAERGLLVRVAGDESRGPSWRFRQPMVREAAYLGLPEADRRRMHARLAAELMAAAAREDVPEMRVAWHLERAGEPGRAAEFYLQAGNAARRIHSNREALRLYDRALPLLPPRDEAAFAARELRAKVLRDLGRHGDREENLARMAGIAEALDDDGRRALVDNQRAQLAYDLGDFDGAAARLAGALDAAARLQAPALQVESLRLLAYVAAEQGHLVRALDCCRRARAVVPEGPDRAYLAARVLGVEGLILLMLGHLETAPPALAEALVLFRRIGKRRNESTVMSNMALLAQARGELLEALHLFESAIRIDRQVRDVSARGRKLAGMGAVRIELGDFEAAARDLEEALHTCRENQEPLGELEAELGLSELALQTGELDRARELEAGGGVLRPAVRSRILAVRRHQLAARLALATGDGRRARIAADEAARIAFEAGMNGEVVHGRVLQAAALTGARLHGEAVVAARRAEELLGDLGGVRRAEEVWWLAASAVHRAGGSDRSGRYLERARAEVARKAALIRDARLRGCYESHPLVQRIAAGFGKG
jgi:tetratricopeptide (TPR) repeat protein